MKRTNKVPATAYGVLQQNTCNSIFDQAAEQVRHLGYGTIDSGYTSQEVKLISEQFNCARENYIEQYGEDKLRELNEYHTIRSLLTHGSEEFIRLALNDNLILVLKKIINGMFILNQQNGVINPPNEIYNQGAWHRDLPYQHFVSSQPLAINALYCVDDFTFENGATFVLPASHKSEAFPSSNFIKANAHQIEAKAGEFILLDCMTFHAGGFNNTDSERRAVNHVYNIPFFKQQINIPNNLTNTNLSNKQKAVLGFELVEPSSIEDYFLSRSQNKY